MTFTQIEYFIEVAKCKNFTKASNNLYITQQVVSKQVHALEKELNIKLFDRGNRHVELTEAGEILFVTWEKMLHETDLALQKVRKNNALNKVKIRMGIYEIPSIIDYMMSKMIEYSKNNPNIEFEYEFGNAVFLQERMRKNKLDLFVTFSSEVDINNDYKYKVLNIMKIDLAIILSKNHPLAKRKNLDLSDIKDETIFIFKDTYSNDAGKKILTYFEEEGFTPKKVRGFDNINNMEISLNMCEGITVAYNTLFRNINAQLKFYSTQGHKGYKKTDLAIVWKNEQFEIYVNDFFD